VERPWAYKDMDLVRHIRSLLRYLTVIGIGTSGVMATDGTFTTEPSDREGLLIAYGVASRLLRGDLLQKLQAGEMGVYFKAGADVIDSKQAGKTLESYATSYEEHFEVLLAILLAGEPEGGVFAYGESRPVVG